MYSKNGTEQTETRPGGRHNLPTANTKQQAISTQGNTSEYSMQQTHNHPTPTTFQVQPLNKGNVHAKSMIQITSELIA
jgi:hypothetical protein